MAENGPGDCHIVDENIDEIEVERDEKNEQTEKFKKQKKQHKQIRNYTNHNPIHFGRNEETYQQHQENSIKGSIVQWTLDSLPSGPANIQYGIARRNSGCFYDQEDYEVEQQVCKNLQESA